MNRVLTGLMAVLLSLLTVISCAQPNTIAAGVDRYNTGVAFLEEGEYDNAIIEQFRGAEKPCRSLPLPEQLGRGP